MFRFPCSLLARVPGEEADGDDCSGDAPDGDDCEVEPFEGVACFEGVERGLARFGEVLDGEDVAERVEPLRWVVEADEDVGDEEDGEDRSVGDSGFRRPAGE